MCALIIHTTTGGVFKGQERGFSGKLERNGIDQPSEEIPGIVDSEFGRIIERNAGIQFIVQRKMKSFRPVYGKEKYSKEQQGQNDQNTGKIGRFLFR